MQARHNSSATHLPFELRKREIDILRLRSELLSSKDKAFIQMIFEKGSSFEQIARLTRQNPSTISRRFHGLLQKLLAKELVSALHNRKEFSRLDHSITHDYYIQGLPQKTIAGKLNVSLYRVRKTLQAVRDLAYGNITSAIQRNRQSAFHKERKMVR